MFTLAQMAPLVGATFTVQTSGGPQALRLASAQELPRRGLPEVLRTPLSLIFEGEPGISLRQDNYMISHPTLGEHVLTIVPVAPGGALGKPEYQILFT